MSRAARIALKISLGVVATPVVLVVLTLGLLLLPQVREWIADRAVLALNRQGDLRVELDALERIDPWGLDAQGVSLRDASGKMELDVGRVSLRISPFSLLRGELVIRRLAVSQVRGALRRGEPTAEKDGRVDADEENSNSTFTVRVQALVLDDVILDVYGFAPVSRVEVLALRAAGALSDTPWVFLSQADLTVEGERGRLLRLNTREGHWDIRSGGLLRLSGELAGAPLELTANMGAVDWARFPRGQATVTVRALKPHSFSRFGLTNAEVRVPIDLELRATSEGEHVDAFLGVMTPKGRAQVRARASRREVSASVYARSANLSELSGLLPELSVYGTVEGDARYAETGTEFRAGSRYVVVDGIVVPDGEIFGSYDGETVTLSSLRVAGLERELSAQGAWNLQDSSMEADVQLDDLDLKKVDRRAHPIRGKVSGRIRLGLSRFEEAIGELTLHAKQLHVSDFSAEDTRLDLSLSGNVSFPRVMAEVNVSGMTAWDTRVQALSLRGEADRREAHAELETHGAGFLFGTEIHAANLRGNVMRVYALGQGEVHGLPIGLEARAQVDRERDQSALSLFLASGKNQVTAHAAFDQQQRVQAQVDLLFPELAALSKVLNVADLGGAITGQIMVDGALSTPSFEARIDGRGMSARKSPRLAGSFSAQGSLARGDVAADLRVFTERDGAFVSLVAEAHVPKGRGGKLDLPNATHRGDVKARIPLSLIAKQAGPKLEGLTGLLDLSLLSSGNVRAPAVHALLEGELRVPSEELEPETLCVVLDANTERATLHAEAQDQEGELIELDGEARWLDFRRMLEGLGALELPTFHVRGKLSPRRLDKMQGALAFLTRAYKVDMPVQVGADLDLKGHENLINGAARAHVVVHGDALYPQCALGASSDVALGLDFKDNAVTAHLKAKTNEGGVVDASLSTHVRIDKNGGSAARFDAVELRARGTGIELAKLPGLCDLASGHGAFIMNGKAFAGKAPELLLEVGLDDVKAEDGEPLSASLVAKLDEHALRAEGTLFSQRKQVGSLEARIPVVMDMQAIRMEIPKKERLFARVRLKALPLAPILSFGEGLGRPRGTATGSLELRGTLASPRPRMDVRLSKVSFSIAEMAQPLRDIDGRITLRGNKLRIEGLTAHDRSGRARLDGQAQLKEDGSGQATVRVDTKDFPLRRQGEVVAELTTSVTAKAQMDPALRVKSDVYIKGGRLWITGERGRSVQSLAAHPDITFADQKTEESVDEPKTKLAVALTDLRVRTERLVWVMHRDFSVQLSINVRLQQEAEGKTMTGGVEIRRGNLQLLGRTFEIERGVIALTGDFPPDPQIELRALHKTRGGDDLYVTLSGRSSSPVLSFSGAASNAAEAMALLTGASRAGAETEAQTDARNFAASLTAGLLSVAIREELGAWVPVIIIESDESGAPTRGRAGFEASKLIPRFLRPIAKGAYVEGIVGTTDQVGGSVGIGARLEISFPYDFLTSTGYGPGPTWAADLLWAP